MIKVFLKKKNTFVSNKAVFWKSNFGVKYSRRNGCRKFDNAEGNYNEREKYFTSLDELEVV